MATASTGNPGVRSNLNDLNVRLLSVLSHLSDIHSQLETPPPTPAANSTGQVPQSAESRPIGDALGQAHAIVDDIQRKIDRLKELI